MTALFTLTIFKFTSNILKEHCEIFFYIHLNVKFGLALFWQLKSYKFKLVS